MKRLRCWHSPLTSQRLRRFEGRNKGTSFLREKETFLTIRLVELKDTGCRGQKRRFHVSKEKSYERRKRILGPLNDSDQISEDTQVVRKLRQGMVCIFLMLTKVVIVFRNPSAKSVSICFDYHTSFKG